MIRNKAGESGARARVISMTENTTPAAEPAPEPAPGPTPEELEAQITAARERLAESVDSLADAANPLALAESGVAKVKEWFVDPETGLRTDRVAKVAGAVVGFVLLRGIIRRGS
jgi:hypothetical protein